MDKATGFERLIEISAVPGSGRDNAAVRYLVQDSVVVPGPGFNVVAAFALKKLRAGAFAGLIPVKTPSLRHVADFEGESS